MMNCTRAIVFLAVLLMSSASFAVDASDIRQGDIISFEMRGERFSSSNVRRVVRDRSGRLLAFQLSIKGQTKIVLTSQLKSLRRISKGPAGGATSQTERSLLRGSETAKVEPYFTIANLSDQVVEFTVQSFTTLDGEKLTFPGGRQVLFAHDEGYISYQGKPLRPKYISYTLKNKYGRKQFRVDGIGRPIRVSFIDKDLPKRKPPKKRYVSKRSSIPTASTTGTTNSARYRSGLPSTGSSTRQPTLWTIGKVLAALQLDRWANRTKTGSLFGKLRFHGLKYVRNKAVESSVRDCLDEYLTDREIKAVSRVLILLWDKNLSLTSFTEATLKDEIKSRLAKEDPKLGAAAGAVDFIYEVLTTK